MDLGLKDKVIVVTGGAKGIGEGITRLLAREGAIPVIVGRNEKDNVSLIKEIGTGFQVTTELSNPDACREAIDKVLQQYNKIDGVVNNAGINDGVSLEHGNYKDFMQSLHNNVVHYYMVVQAALPALKKSKGSVVNPSRWVFLS